MNRTTRALVLVLDDARLATPRPPLWLVALILILILGRAPSLPAAEFATNALAPAAEQASFHLADAELTVELVAAEPDVVSPVAVAWDADGRLFVAEMPDYPNAP